MIFPFQPSALQNFVFNPVLDGVTYVATIVWNVFGQRWYLSLTDTSGAQVVYKAVTSSEDPQALAALSWSQGVVTATTTNPHHLPLGSQALLYLHGTTPDTFNGFFLCTVTGPSSFTFPVTADPGSLVQLGVFNGFDDLTAGLFQTSKLLYYAASSTFEAVP